jgi:hypothetical protein
MKQGKLEVKTYIVRSAITQRYSLMLQGDEWIRQEVKRKLQTQTARAFAHYGIGLIK